MLGVAFHNRNALVCALAEGLVERDLTEETRFKELGSGVASAFAEDVGAFARFGVLEIGHVFSNPEDGDVDFGEHHCTALGDVAGKFLRCCHDDSAVEGDCLSQGELGVTGSGREVDDEAVELAPVDLAGELLNGFVDHRATPDDGCIFVNEEAHGHHGDAEIGKGIDRIAFDFWSVVEAQEGWSGWTVDVAVHDPYPIGTRVFAAKKQVKRAR